MIKKTKGKPNAIDQFVGQRIAFFRNQYGYSQVEVAEKMNITFQQIQKYEAGKNRVAASRLYQMAMIFETNVSAFFPNENKTSQNPVNQSILIKDPALKKTIEELVEICSKSN